MKKNRDRRWHKYKQDILEKIGDFSSIYADLEKQQASSDGWASAQCPFHRDRNPSFSFNTENGRWICHKGCGKGSVFDYLMKKTGKEFREVLLEMGDQLGIPRPDSKIELRPTIREDQIKRWAKNLRADGDVYHWLREKRGLSDKTIKKYEIGWDPKRQRYTIPIRDERGKVVNVRLYSVKKKPKILNYTEGRHRYGTPARLYGLDELVRADGREVVLCEGEWDRLLLQQEGFTAVTGTHGASTFRLEWLPHFKGKNVVLLFDCDPAGQAAAAKLLQAFKAAEVASVRNVVLPLKGTKSDKDITDYFHVRGQGAEDLQKLIHETTPHDFKVEEQQEEVVDLHSFTEIENKDLIDKKVSCEIAICGETSEAFHAVEAFRVSFCPKMKKGECFKCMEPVVIPKSAQEYIGSCMSTNMQVTGMLRDYACRYGQKPAIEVLRRTTVKEFFCHQKVNRITQTQNERGDIVQMINGKQQELIEKKAYFLSSEHPKPGNYRAAGWVKSHPKTQQVTFLIETLEPMEDDFESFRIEDNIEHLRAYKALTWKEIVQDLTENVTRIYEREELLTSILLTYCSPRWIPFNGEIIRGWLVTVILGDSGSGKTQTYQRISEFANIGDCLSGLTGSRTGLAYALVEHRQKGWQVRIGRYPANSRKILMVDETQHLPDWDLRTISKAMEEGFLQIDRVQSKGYESQTRLIMIANPKRDRTMDTFSFGCEALKTVFPPTIIRRSDVAVFANSGDLKDLSVINRRTPKRSTQRITPDMLRAVIYWIWNLRPDQIIFSPKAEKRCLNVAGRLSAKYGFAVDIPLITLSDCRNKLARIATAFAALRLSTDESFSSLVVEPRHVRQAENFLEDIYEHENCGLDEYSDIQRAGSQLLDYEEIVAAFIEKREHEKHAEDEEAYFSRTIHALRINQQIRRDDLAEHVGCSVESTKRYIRLLKRYNLVESTREGYIKKPKFNKFLSRFLKSNPEFLSENSEGQVSSGCR